MQIVKAPDCLLLKRWYIEIFILSRHEFWIALFKPDVIALSIILAFIHSAKYKTKIIKQESLPYFQTFLQGDHVFLLCGQSLVNLAKYSFVMSNSVAS